MIDVNLKRHFWKGKVDSESLQLGVHNPNINEAVRVGAPRSNSYYRNSGVQGGKMM